MAKSETPPPATTVPDSYFPQPLRWIEGALFHAIATEPTRLGYYCIDTSLDEVAMTPRTDEIIPEGGGRWRLRTQPRTNGPTTETLYDRNGRMIRRTWPDQTVTVPIEPDALLRLWKRKGLPTKPVRARRR